MRPLSDRRHGVVVLTMGMLMLLVSITFSQHGGAPDGHHQPGAGHLVVQRCAEEFERVVAQGRGFGMAFVADQHGYPGPMHVLELQERLQLTAAQETEIRAMMHATLSESKPKSAQLLEAEQRLRQLFAAGTADEASVRTAVREVERARSEVRLVHLLTHLRTRELLTEEQRRLYHEARWASR
jgi:Spy/CpxP family protein refolding chaperone